MTDSSFAEETRSSTSGIRGCRRLPKTLLRHNRYCSWAQSPGSTPSGGPSYCTGTQCRSRTTAAPPLARLEAGRRENTPLFELNCLLLQRCSMPEKMHRPTTHCISIMVGTSSSETRVPSVVYHRYRPGSTCRTFRRIGRLGSLRGIAARVITSL